MLVTIYHQNPNIVKSAGYHPRPIDSVSLKGAVIVAVVCDVDHHCVTPPVIVGLISCRHLIFHGHSQGTATKHNTHTVIFLEIQTTNH
jgi:hypothetical protein